MKHSKLQTSNLPYGKSSSESYDISVVLNLHNEARYLRRTLLSLEESVRYARQFDISTELVVVLDNADKPTRKMAEDHDYSVFDAIQMTHVQNGSLGLSRNDGIALARGEYIATADADDLMSFDFLQKMYMTVRSSLLPSIVFPEYLFGFGQKTYIWKFFGQAEIGNSVLFASHHYTSRAIFHKSVPDRVKYAHASPNSGYAFEDWHFNCECIAAGYSIAIAEGAILFYRQRTGSLLRQSDSQAVRLTPPGKYFEPNTFSKLTWSEFNTPKTTQPPAFDRQEFFDMPGVVDLVAGANKIDPMISLGILRGGEFGSNLPPKAPVSRVYFEACQRIGGQRFTDVLLLPFMARGGAEKYILSVIEGIRRLEPESRLLVLTTQRGVDHSGNDWLPDDCALIDLCDASLPEVDRGAIEIVVLRLLQHAAGVKRVHFKNCEFVDGFLRKYMRYLKHLDTTLYYFGDPQVAIGGVWFRDGHVFDLVSECGHDVTRVISDHSQNVDEISHLISAEIGNSVHTLYATCLLSDVVADNAAPTGRMLWASRMDAQKRPDLLPRIAAELARRDISATIDVRGSTVLGDAGASIFEGFQSLSYGGPFNGAQDLPWANYDALVYTAAYDGLPNIVLEAMAAELPVIAPDVGGIGEAVTGETGYLVANDVNDDALVERYVSAIEAIYGDWAEARRRAGNARQLIADRHSQTAFVDRVGDLFGLGKDARRRSRLNS